MIADQATVVSFSQGWLLAVEAGPGPYIYLDWARTGSQDPHLPDMTAWEARELAATLLRAADKVNPPCGWLKRWRNRVRRRHTD